MLNTWSIGVSLLNNLKYLVVKLLLQASTSLTYQILLILVFLCDSTGSIAQLVNNPAQLNDAIEAAIPGTTITLADGIWNNVFIDVDKDGTSLAPIVLTAQHPGAVLLTGNSRVYLEGDYLTVMGLVFQDPSNLLVEGDRIEPVIELKRCNYCKVLNNKIDTYNGTAAQKELKFKWILADGQYNEIAYNSFIGKYGVGSIINDNRNTSEPDYLKIHHNYFADRTPINEVNEDNDQDAIRIGNSSTSLEDSFTEVYSNYFYNFFGEVEVISNKSGQNKYYNNTFRKYAGTLTLRHGDNCVVYGNYFFAENNTFSGGVRVIGEGHKIYNNYIQGVNSTKPDGSTSNATGGINVSNGRLNSALNGYYQVKRAQVVNNTFVDCDYALRIGTQVSSNLDQAPEDLVVANNIMYNTRINAYQLVTPPIGGSVAEGNITSLAASDLIDDGNFHRLTNGSAPIDAGLGNYTFISHDLLGGVRDARPDAGAEEFGANGLLLPYQQTDVGVSVGFGAIPGPTLSTTPSTLTFGLYADTLTFEVVANVDWLLTEDIPWLGLDIVAGSGNTWVTATVTENTTGAERTATISLQEAPGGDDLADTLDVVQLNTFIPVEIPIIGATSVGKEDKEGITEENAYNDDTSNYWTGDPDAEPEVAITFDLGCSHTLTEIGINFWKADERTTTFSIAIAENAAGPFTIILDTETSAANNVNVDTEQLFNLGGVVGRYVKFIGIGNSSASNWTSIANVNIYGNPICETLTGINNSYTLAPSVTLFPVPTTNGSLNIKSASRPLQKMEIYNVDGKKILSLDGNNAYTKQIDLTHLPAGVYFIRLEELGHAKFIVK